MKDKKLKLMDLHVSQHWGEPIRVPSIFKFTSKTSTLVRMLTTFALRCEEREHSPVETKRFFFMNREREI
jgi:hypothetical protein